MKKVQTIKPIEIPNCKPEVSDTVGLLLSYLTHISSGSVVEIGCGASTGCIVPFLKENQAFYSIDIDYEKIENVFSVIKKEKVGQPFPGKFIAEDSRGFDMRHINDRNIGLLWIDGDHSLSGIMCDVARFLPILNIGGYLIAHDFLSGIHSITPAVNFFCNFIIQNSEHFGLKPFSTIQNFIEIPGSPPFKEPLCEGCERKDKFNLAALNQVFLAQKVSNQFITYMRYGL